MNFASFNERNSKHDQEYVGNDQIQSIVIMVNYEHDNHVAIIGI